ncbi:non-ribosomal peptide synthetase [Massilia sp. CFBP 13647]|uniref:non-ribosomal peptide synthetase n=3 Tax=unclassified Massilia TaxID=2609279 RepID=UPI001784FD94|nr:non-ribosomal peptide synthetase [Massilia sp. CFBP 13647]MBD8529924.1 amino acid adenylation domain-containing protein [Massilia sp. CFBP 13647]
MTKNTVAAGLIEDAFPLSMLQQGMLFHSTLDAHLSVYHDVFSYEIDTAWDAQKFCATLEAIVAKHGVLRTVYKLDAGRPLQVVLKHKAPCLVVEDLRGVDAGAQLALLAAWVESEKATPIDPAKDVWKAFVHVLDDSRIQFGLSFHHALWDGWSVANFVSELFSGYTAALEGRENTSFGRAKPPSYRTFVALEQQALNSAANKAYWAAKMRDAKTPWWTGSRSRQSTFFACDITAPQSEQMIGLAAALGVAEKSLWTAVYVSLVALLDGSPDVVGSIATHGRPELPGSDRMLGLFLNTLPLRVDLRNRRWRELIREVDAELRGQYAYRHHPLVDVQNQTGLDFSGSMFGYLNFHVYGESGVKSKILGGQGFEETNYSMVVSVEKLDAARRHVLRVNGDGALFDAPCQERIRAYVTNIVDAMTAADDQPIRLDALIGAGERELQQWPQPAAAEGVDAAGASLPRAFARALQGRGAAPALVAGGASLSYGALDRRSNQLANFLAAAGLGQGSVVAVQMDASFDTVVAMLAALKLGGSYVLVDAAAPVQRQSWTIRNAGARAVLGRAPGAARLPGVGAHILDLRAGHDGYLQAGAQDPAVAIDPQALAALAYGSAYPCGDAAMAAGFSHASLLYAASAQQGDAACMLDRFKGIDGAWPQLWRGLLAGVAVDLDGPGQGGAPLPDLPLVLARADASEFHVMDGGSLVPVGTVGELLVGGPVQVSTLQGASGQSAARLVPHPFAPAPGRHLLATGVRARLLSNGDLEVLPARKDGWKAIRRRLLRDAEQLLRLQPGVADVAFEMEDSFGGPGMAVAYCVPEDEDAMAGADIGVALRAGAAPCLLPAALVPVAKIARMPNGDVDFSQLDSPFLRSRDARFEWPLGACEELLADIWMELLKCERVGRNDNFFALGGYSLVGMQLVARIRNVFGVELPLRQVFEHSDLAAQARLIEEAQDQGAALPALAPVARERALPLSFSQQRLWFLSRMMAPNAVYNIPLALRLGGALDEGALERALNAVVDRHEALRTRFAEVDGQALQVIDPAGRACVVVEDVATEEELHARYLAERGYCYDLSNEPLVRLRLLRTAFDGKVVLLASFHHIVFDGWSMGIFFKDLAQLYQRESGAAGTQPLAPLPIQFADYAHWQREQLTGEVIAAQMAYWERQLAGLPPLLELPTDRPRPAEQRYCGAMAECRLDAGLVASLQALNRSCGSTLFMSLASAFALLLGRYARQEDVAIGTPVANRRHSETEGLIGFFLNSLVLRFDLSGQPSFRKLLVAAREMSLQAYAHQDVPFEHLVERLNPARSLSHAPLFQVSCSLVNTPVAASAFPGLEIAPLQYAEDEGVARYDLTFNFSAQADGSLRGNMEYNTDLFDRPTIERFLGHYEHLLQEIVARPDAAIADYALLGQAERQQLLTGWNDGPHTFETNRCLHQLFEAQAARNPDAVALSFEGSETTYGELNRRANQLAHRLRARGVGPDRPDCLVALVIERSTEMVVAILGILKAGGAYVPIDPASPQDRIDYMLADCGAELVLTAADLAGLEGERGDNPAPAGLTPDHLAYVIYTSGSTGKPKGVLVEHRNVAQLMAATEADFSFSERDTWTLFHSFAFDFSVWEIWGALAYGGKLVVVPKAVAQSPLDFYELACREKVTVLNQTPSAFAGFIEADAQLRGTLSLRAVVFGGEKLKPASLLPWTARHGDEAIALVNMYGITETTVHVTYRRLRQADLEGACSLIGPQLSHLTLYILDGATMQPAPLGVAGELFVGGSGVARGYLNQPELTAQKFVANPFADDPSPRLYRSGDLARRLANGEIEFIGRIDNQVKIRGFRIELGEIEAQLMGHAAVQSAVVLVREDTPGDKRLAAYLVFDPSAEAPFDAAGALRAHLAATLPDYMLPGAYVVLESLPLTNNGKLDTRRLPRPDTEAYARRQYAAPTNALEEKLAQLWQQNLGVAQVGIDDNYFAVGGDSIRSMSLVADARQAGLQFAIRDLFAHPTIAGLAGVVREGAAQGGEDEVAPFALLSEVERAHLPAQVHGRPVQDAYPLSLLQQGMLFHSLRDPELNLYQNVLSFMLDLEWDETCFRRALEKVAALHPVLRTAFHLDGERPLQLVLPDAPQQIDVFDLRGERQEDLRARVLGIQDGVLAQGIDTAAPWRTFVCLLPERMVRLNFVVHHALMDGWSDAILIKQVLQVYGPLLRGETPAPLTPPPRYSNFITLEQDALASPRCKQYWTELLDGVRVPWWTASAKTPSVRFACPVSAQVSERVGHLAATLGVQEKSIWAAAYLAFLSLLDGSARTVGSVVTHGRPEMAGADQMLGLFLNAVPLACDLRGMRWRDLIAQTDARLAEYYTIRHYPLAAVQADSGLDFSGAAFNYTNFHVYKTANAGAELDVGGGFDETNYRLLVNVRKNETSGRHMFLVNAEPSVFDAAMRERMAGYVEAILVQMTADAAAPIDKSLLLANEAAVNDAPACLVPAAPPCVHERFARQAAAQPGATALVHEGRRLSYGELNARANRLAHYLRAQGVGRETRVGICLPPSFDLVLSMLAVLKAGACYVPVDPDYPAARRDFVIADSGVALILTDKALAASALGHLDPARLLEVDERRFAACPDTDPGAGAVPANAVYVIYTSGSTGQPKGVLGTHRALMNRLLWAEAEFGVEPDEVLCQKTRIGFVDHAAEIFQALLSGRPLLIVGREQAGSPAGLADALAAGGVTRITLVPSLLKAMLALERPLPALRHVFCSGEALVLGEERAAFARSFPNARLANVYGSTEVGADVSCHRAAGADALAAGPVPIGRVIANTDAWVLDEQMNRVPLGVVGQLYIGGAGLARGYLGKAAATAAGFVPHPFAAQPGERLYNTGDLVRMDASGTLDYAGRRDHQFKIRGFRIEAGEIELAAAGVAGVAQAVVKLWDGQQPGELQIALYLTALSAALDTEAGAALKRSVRAQLRQALPDYMWPASVTLLDKLPLTPSGKLDRRALPLPAGDAGDSEFVAPTGATEELLAGLWCELLRRERVGRDDNFFELGGHSLIATQLLSRIRDVFACALPMRQLFEHQSLEGQARAIDALRSVAAASPSDTIEAAGRDAPLPLSYAQQRLWFLDQLMGAAPTYNIPLALRLSGALRLDLLVESLNAIVRRHDILRARFSKNKGEAVQDIRPFEAVKPVFSEAAGAAALERVWLEEKNFRFDLARDLLVRFHVVRDLSQAEPSCVLFAVFHHIVSDGWSMAIFFRELVENYQALAAGGAIERAPLRIQYQDFAAWQRKHLDAAVLDGQLHYWRERLAGLPASLDLPFDRPRPAEQTFNGDSVALRFPLALSEGLQQLGRKQGATLFMTLMSVYAVLLARYARQSDIVIGTPVANRDRREAEDLIGFFVNTLVLRNQVPGKARFADFLKSTRESCLDAYAHQDLPFECLVEALNPQRSLSHSPLFQVMFVLQNTPLQSAAFSDIDVAPVAFESSAGSARFDLTLGMKETPQGLIGSLEYNTDLFDRATMLRFAAAYEYLLEQVVAQPQAVIEDLRVVRGADLALQLVDWNATAMDYPQALTLHAQFERQAARHPQRTALRCGGQSVSYAELNARANRRAHALIARGLAPEACVGICLPRSAESVVSLLAVLKAGACYVPIDPAYPAARVQYLLGDADMPVVITTAELAHQLGIAVDKRWCVEEEGGDFPAADPGRAIDSNRLAYIIYTSGSTGRPKGVAINHRGASSLLHWAGSKVAEADRTGVLAGTSFCFDLSIYELFLPLTTGHTCILVDHILALDTLDAESRALVTLVNTVPSAARVLLDRKLFPASARVLNLAGEPLKAALVDRVYAETAVGQVVDLYGPSEGTTYSSWAQRQAGGAETIGRPVANTQFYVLSEGGQLLPQGVTGELYIGGVGVARGYLQRPGLTAEKFVPNRFSAEPGERLYRTGDLVRHRADGQLDYLGRADHQVKVRGFRIELGEIENACLQHPGVKEAVAIVREDQPGERRIVVYVVSQAAATGQDAGLADALKADLRLRLAGYMTPSAFVRLEALPLTPNGKLDRAALPLPDGPAASGGAAFAAPEGATETALAEVWQALLRRRQVGRADNFFELGGHSLLVTQLASRIEEVFGITLHIKTFYEHPALQDLALRIEKKVAIATMDEDAMDLMSEEELAELLSELDASENN